MPARLIRTLTWLPPSSWRGIKVSDKGKTKALTFYVLKSIKQKTVLPSRHSIKNLLAAGPWAQTAVRVFCEVRAPPAHTVFQPRQPDPPPFSLPGNCPAFLTAARLIWLPGYPTSHARTHTLVSGRSQPAEALIYLGRITSRLSFRPFRIR